MKSQSRIWLGDLGSGLTDSLCSTPEANLVHHLYSNKN